MNYSIKSEKDWQTKWQKICKHVVNVFIIAVIPIYRFFVWQILYLIHIVFIDKAKSSIKFAFAYVHCAIKKMGWDNDALWWADIILRLARVPFNDALFLLEHFIWNLELLHFNEVRWHINEQNDTKMGIKERKSVCEERERESLKFAICKVLNCICMSTQTHCCTHYTLVSNIINIIQYTWQYQYSKIKFYSDLA